MKSRERSFEPMLRGLRMMPRIEPRRRLRKPGEINRLSQRQIRSVFVEIGARRCFRAEAAIAVTAVVQVVSEDALLRPATLQFPGDDRFEKFVEPAATRAVRSELDELLRDG